MLKFRCSNSKATSRRVWWSLDWRTSESVKSTSSTTLRTTHFALVNLAWRTQVFLRALSYAGRWF